MREILAAARLDLAEVRRSRWLVFCVVVYALLAGALVLVGLRESTVLGFTGVGRVLLGFAHALVTVLPLLALTATGQVIGRARDDGSLELLLSHPIRRTSWLAGVTLARFAVLALPLCILTLAIGAYASLRGQPVPWAFVGHVLAISCSLLWVFVAIGIAISVFVRNQARAIVYVVVVWAAAVALLDVGLIGMLLRWHLEPRVVFTLAALDPVQDARLALLSDLQPDLGSLGPVGFYLSTHLGPSRLQALALAWPALLGAMAWTSAALWFRRSDVS
jgi:ABC-type transport system involved in multi-copper enzyme maturation permease subunit